MRPILTPAMVLSLASMTFAQSTEFTYQGRLMESGAPADGLFDMRVRLFDVPTGGTPITVLCADDVDVIDGLFTVPLDFGDAINGDERYLEFAVKHEVSEPCGGLGSTFTTLAPRQQITAAPYALRTRGLFVDAAENVGIGTETPGATLDVRGSMKLGSGGELFAPGGQENLRIIRGSVSSTGAILEGTGFTVSHRGTGLYLITFNTAFSDAPSVIGSCGAARFFSAGSFTVTSADVATQSGSTGSSADAPFQFIAVGPR